MANAPAAAPDPAAAPPAGPDPASTPAAAPPDPAPDQPLGPGQDDVEGFLEQGGDSPESDWDQSSADPQSPNYQPTGAASPAGTPPAAGSSPSEPPPAAGQTPAGASSQPPANPAANAPPGYVPVQALDESRAETKQLKETVARLDGNFQTFVQLARQQQGGQPQAPGAAPTPGQTPAAAPVPDKETDPVAYLEHQIAELKSRLPDPQQQQQVAEQTANMQQFQTTIAEKEAEFEAQHPDYGQALSFLRDVRTQEIVGFGATLTQARSKVLFDEMQAAAHALSQGVDPVAKVYELAKARGYQPPAPANGGTPPGAPAPTNPTLAAVADGLAHGQTAGTANATGQTAPTTLEELSQLQDQVGPNSEARFAAAWNRMMGGGNAALDGF